MAKKHKGRTPSESEATDFASPACYAHEVDPAYMMAPERTKRVVPKNRGTALQRSGKRRPARS